MVTQREIKSYIRQVKKACPFSFRRKMLFSLKSGIADYIEENPDSSIDDIIERFGKPETFAPEYIAAMDDNERIKAFRTAKIIKCSIIVGVALFILIVFVTAVCIIIENSRTAVYYYYEVID